MTRITKQIAKELTEKLLVKRSKELEELRKVAAGIVHNEYSKKIPEDVRLCFIKHRSYFKNIQCGLTKKYFFYLDLPGCSGGVLRPIDLGDESMKIAAEVEEFENELWKAQITLESAIFDLRTINAVKNTFPELDISDNPKLFPSKITPDLIQWLNK